MCFVRYLEIFWGWDLEVMTGWMDGQSCGQKAEWSGNNAGDLGSEEESAHYPCLSDDKGDKEKLGSELRLRTQLIWETHGHKPDGGRPRTWYLKGKSKRFWGAIFFLGLEAVQGHLPLYFHGYLFLQNKKTSTLSVVLNWKFDFQIHFFKFSEVQRQEMNSKCSGHCEYTLSTPPHIHTLHPPTLIP